jgi:DDE superfamily endonuclease
MLKLHIDQVKLPTKDRPLDTRIAGDDKYFPFFRDCIGAIDGTHIEVYVDTAQVPAFRNRKGTLSQNVLGVCTFDLQFSYIYPGWEGSAHDVRVLDDAMNQGDFEIPAGKFYLADAGYTNR